MRGAEIDRKWYTEDLDSLTGVIFFFLLRTVYIKEPGFLSVPSLRLCDRR